MHGAELALGDALPVARISQHEDVRLRFHHAHAHDGIVLPSQPDADDTGRISAHGADLVLAEAGDATHRRGQDDVVVAGRHLHPG